MDNIRTIHACQEGNRSKALADLRRYGKSIEF